MTPRKSLALGAALLVGATLAASAQAQYPAYPAYPYPAYPTLAPPTPPPVQTTAPPSWYYNPYTSGLGPCPQRFGGDPPCSETVDPSYGQPNFWPR